MKYRVRVDLSFANETDARSLMDFAKTSSSLAANLNEDEANCEISFCELELCRHEEDLPCVSLEKLVVGE